MKKQLFDISIFVKLFMKSLKDISFTTYKPKRDFMQKKLFSIFCLTFLTCLVLKGVKKQELKGFIYLNLDLKIEFWMIKLGKNLLTLKTKVALLGTIMLGSRWGIRVAQKEVWAHFISPLEVSPSKKKLVVP